MPKTACRIVAVLLDDKFTGQESRCDLTALCVFRNECGHVAVNRSFACSVTSVDALNNINVDAIKLDSQSVVAECENAEFAAIEAVDTIDLRGGNDFSFL